MRRVFPPVDHGKRTHDLRERHRDGAQVAYLFENTYKNMSSNDLVDEAEQLSNRKP